MRRGSTSRRGSTGALPRSRSRAARTLPPVPCWSRSTTPRRSPSTSRRWQPRSSPRRSSRTSMPARGRGHRRAQGRARAGAGERGAGAKDLRPHAASWRSTAMHRRRGSTRRPIPCTRASARVDQAKSAYEQAVNGYTREEHRDRGSERRQGAGRHQGRPIHHRSDGDLRAGRLAGLPAQRRAGRIRFARRAAGHA